MDKTGAGILVDKPGSAMNTVENVKKESGDLSPPKKSEDEYSCVECAKKNRRPSRIPRFMKTEKSSGDCVKASQNVDQGSKQTRKDVLKTPLPAPVTARKNVPKYNNTLSLNAQQNKKPTIPSILSRYSYECSKCANANKAIERALFKKPETTKRNTFDETLEEIRDQIYEYIKTPTSLYTSKSEDIDAIVARRYTAYKDWQKKNYKDGALQTNNSYRTSTSEVEQKTTDYDQEGVETNSVTNAKLDDNDKSKLTSQADSYLFVSNKLQRSIAKKLRNNDRERDISSGKEITSFRNENKNKIRKQLIAPRIKHFSNSKNYVHSKVFNTETAQERIPKNEFVYNLHEQNIVYNFKNNNSKHTKRNIEKPKNTPENTALSTNILVNLSESTNNKNEDEVLSNIMNNTRSILSILRSIENTYLNCDRVHRSFDIQPFESLDKSQYKSRDNSIRDTARNRKPVYIPKNLIRNTETRKQKEWSNELAENCKSKNVEKPISSMTKLNVNGYIIPNDSEIKAEQRKQRNLLIENPIECYNISEKTSDANFKTIRQSIWENAIPETTKNQENTLASILTIARSILSILKTTENNSFTANNAEKSLEIENLKQAISYNKISLKERDSTTNSALQNLTKDNNHKNLTENNTFDIGATINKIWSNRSKSLTKQKIQDENCLITKETLLCLTNYDEQSDSIKIKDDEKVPNIKDSKFDNSYHILILNDNVPAKNKNENTFNDIVNNKNIINLSDLALQINLKCQNMNDKFYQRTILTNKPMNHKNVGVQPKMKNKLTSFKVKLKNTSVNTITDIPETKNKDTDFTPIMYDKFVNTTSKGNMTSCVNTSLTMLTIDDNEMKQIDCKINNKHNIQIEMEPLDCNPIKNNAVNQNENSNEKPHRPAPVRTNNPSSKNNNCFHKCLKLFKSAKLDVDVIGNSSEENWSETNQVTLTKEAYKHTNVYSHQQMKSISEYKTSVHIDQSSGHYEQYQNYYVTQIIDHNDAFLNKTTIRSNIGRKLREPKTKYFEPCQEKTEYDLEVSDKDNKPFDVDKTIMDLLLLELERKTSDKQCQTSASVTTADKASSANKLKYKTVFSLNNKYNVCNFAVETRLIPMLYAEPVHNKKKQIATNQRIVNPTNIITSALDRNSELVDLVTLFRNPHRCNKRERSTKSSQRRDRHEKRREDPSNFPKARKRNIHVCMSNTSVQTSRLSWQRSIGTSTFQRSTEHYVCAHCNH